MKLLQPVQPGLWLSGSRSRAAYSGGSYVPSGGEKPLMMKTIVLPHIDNLYIQVGRTTMKKNLMLPKWARLVFIILLGVIPAIVLSGCSSASPLNPIESGSSGIFNHYFIYPFSLLIKFFADVFHGNYGLSIVLMTFIIRLAIMPLMMNQTKKQMDMKDKMAVLQPELTALKEKYKDDNTAEAKKQQQAEMMELYQKHQFNPLNMGCLPMLIQWPVTLAFYYAIRRTPEIAAHDFLWFSLGKPDIILPLIAAAVYYIQFRVSQSASAQPQPNPNSQMAFIGLLSPVMMGVFSFGMPAALPLYWAVGGIFIIVQTIILNRMYTKPPKE
ncbi:membrane protein insertase YidC [Paenibacillus sp. MMS20-IR301]|uniref:membrane protein insertase YidC n=1 Tax=Paenibacillus sp. MMS20-IR301 TaxID=2895946 RepID=UPI0028E685E9|nr:membrane protein insertase YidC [Paenibacillus sp. MMS20-IR301]WNS43722.1 membrane protein insertase YidC [Paenibacillus sp. MMS20-IR301]